VCFASESFCFSLICGKENIQELEAQPSGLASIRTHGRDFQDKFALHLSRERQPNIF